MSNFYGGKQGFSFFITKTYIIEKALDGYKEKNVDNEGFNSIDNLLEYKFNNDRDVHYNDYVLISMEIMGSNFASSNSYHGNLYRKDITNFKLVGNLAGPPGGTSEVIPLDWDRYEEEYNNDLNQYGESNITSSSIANMPLSMGIIDGKTNNKIYFKYYLIKTSAETAVLKLAIQTPAIYIDLSRSYYPENVINEEGTSGTSPKVNFLGYGELENGEKNYFYSKYEYPLVTKYYKPRIENDELYGDLYTYQQVEGSAQYSYQQSDSTDSLYLGKIKQESGILIGQNLAYYILASEAGQLSNNKYSQTDEELNDYIISKEKRNTLRTEKTEGYVLLENKKVICKKLNDDFPCGLGYDYFSEQDHTKRTVTNVDLVGKIITYGDEEGPLSESMGDKVITWFFAYDFSREEDSSNGEIIPNWYYLSLYSSETKIIFALDNDSGTLPETSEEIKQGDLWIGLSNPI